MKHNVESPVEKVKEWILLDYPSYYKKSEVVKKDIISLFVQPIHCGFMYEYMEKDGGVDG